MQQQPIQVPPGQFNQPLPEVSGPTVFMTADPQQKEPPFSKKPAKFLSLVQIILGGISFLAQLITILIVSNDGITERFNIDYIGGIGEGIYCGLFFIIAGFIGLSTSNKPTSCKISAFMILSIFSSIFSAIQIIICSIKLGVTNERQRYWLESLSNREPKMAMYSIMILAGVAEMMVAIICSSICCRACCCTGTGSSTGRVIYLAQGHQGSGVAPVQVVGGVPPPVQMTGGVPPPVQMTGGVPPPVQMTGGVPAPVQVVGGVPAPVQVVGGVPAPVQMDSFPQTPTQVSGQKWDEPLSDGYVVGDQRKIGDGYGNGGYMRL